MKHINHLWTMSLKWSYSHLTFWQRSGGRVENPYQWRRTANPRRCLRALREKSGRQLLPMLCVVIDSIVYIVKNTWQVYIIYISVIYVYACIICVCMHIYIYTHYALIPILLIWNTSQKNSGFVQDLFMFWDLGMMMMMMMMMMMVIINGNRSERCCGSKAPGQGLFGCFWPSMCQLVKNQKLRLGLRELTRNKKNFALGNIDGCPEIDWLFSNWLGT